MQNIYLITGASSDVGTSLIRRVYRPGDRVIAQGAGDLSALYELKKEVDDLLLIDADLSDISAIRLFVQQLEGQPCPTHFVHLPALRVVNARYKNFDFDRYLLDLNVQLQSAILLTQSILPKMAKAKFGRVLFMLTSYLTSVPPKNVSAYMVAKSALAGLARSLAIDFAKDGVTVNSVLPSMMETKFLQGTSDLIVEASAKANPMGRNARVEDVVPAMAFLLSEEARFITGVELPITGGSAF